MTSLLLTTEPAPPDALLSRGLNSDLTTNPFFMFRAQFLLDLPAPSANKKPLCVPDGVLQAGDTLQVKIHYEKDDHYGWQQVQGEKETKKFC